MSILFQTLLSASYLYGKKINLEHKRCVDFIHSSKELLQKSKNAKQSAETLNKETAEIIENYVPSENAWDTNGVYLPQEGDPKV